MKHNKTKAHACIRGLDRVCGVCPQAYGSSGLTCFWCVSCASRRLHLSASKVCMKSVQIVGRSTLSAQSNRSILTFSLASASSRSTRCASESAMSSWLWSLLCVKIDGGRRKQNRLLFRNYKLQCAPIGATSRS